MQIQHNANLMDHHFTHALHCHTQLVKTKMFCKRISEQNGKCVGN
jgi:hypothetical protein